MFPRFLSAAALLVVALGAAGCAQDASDESDTANAADGDEGSGEVAEDALTAATTQKLKIGQTAHFAKFDVTLRKLAYGNDQEVGLSVKVCAKETSNRVSWAPWRMKTFWGTATPTTIKDIPWHGSQLYPNGTILKAGECAQGIVPFIDDDGETITALTYRNSLGDTAVWK